MVMPPMAATSGNRGKISSFTSFQPRAPTSVAPTGDVYKSQCQNIVEGYLKAFDGCLAINAARDNGSIQSVFLLYIGADIRCV